MILLFILGYLAIVALAWGMTAGAKAYALRHAIVDVPNHRSSHSIPTPRGGGISIAVIVLLSTVILWWTGLIPNRFTLATGGAGLLVSGIGWIDDRYNISVIWRGASYVIAAIWAVYWIVGPDWSGLEGGFIYYALATVATAWLINLYNFMDGSDGLAASQAVCVALVVSILLLSTNQPGLSSILLVLSAACIGFLIWNWPPAGIFMGDAGSCLLGFIFAAMALFTAVEGILSPAVWLILLSVFICDSTLTLLKRMIRGERWYRSHHSHAYQRLLQAGYSHRQLLLGLWLINGLVLMPLAVLVNINDDYRWWSVAGIYFIISGLWCIIQLNSGNEDHDLT